MSRISIVALTLAALGLAGCGDQGAKVGAETSVASPQKAAVTGEQTEVTAFLRRVYASYPDDHSSEGIDLYGPSAREFLTEDFAAAFRADKVRNPEGVGALEFDPIVQGQDWDRLRILEIEAAITGPDTAVANVRFTNGETVNRTVFELKRTAAGWRVADIGNPPDLPSVRALLRGDGTAPAPPADEVRSTGTAEPSSDLNTTVDAASVSDLFTRLSRLQGRSVDVSLLVEPGTGPDSRSGLYDVNTDSGDLTVTSGRQGVVVPRGRYLVDGLGYEVDGHFEVGRVPSPNGMTFYTLTPER